MNVSRSSVRLPIDSCLFLSGVAFFAIYAPKGMNPMVYSALYNGSYLIVEFIVSVIIMYIVVKRRLLEIYL